MRQHLLRVEAPVTVFVPLIAALRAAGTRVGWLELEPPDPGPPSLEAAAATGVLRAVAAGGERSVAVKPLRGAPVLRDLLREHFRGCQLVLVRGAVAAPRLTAADASDWCLALPEGGEVRLTTEALATALRKPDPWSEAHNDESNANNDNPPATAGGGQE